MEVGVEVSTGSGGGVGVDWREAGGGSLPADLR